MKTQVLPVSEESLALAGRILREGGLVGMPTETVYGLAGNALDAQDLPALTQLLDEGRRRKEEVDGH